MKQATPEDSVDALTPPFLFVDKFKWKSRAAFLSKCLSLFSSLNVACLISLDSSYFVCDSSTPYFLKFS